MWTAQTQSGQAAGHQHHQLMESQAAQPAVHEAGLLSHCHKSNIWLSTGMWEDRGKLPAGLTVTPFRNSSHLCCRFLRCMTQWCHQIYLEKKHKTRENSVSFCFHMWVSYFQRSLIELETINPGVQASSASRLPCEGLGSMCLA